MRTRPIALLLALAASACSSEPAKAPTPDPSENAGPATPVVSDGVKPFENQGLGIRAYFPRGDQVCIVRSREGQRGFYARYGAGEPGCPEARGDAAFMGISAATNGPGYSSIREAVGLCQPLTPALIRRMGGKPAFPGRESIACMDDTGGPIMIMVNALGDKADGVSHIVYTAALSTPANRIDRDAAMFRTFLQKLQLGTAPKP